jgi:hypothetical protein
VSFLLAVATIVCRPSESDVSVTEPSELASFDDVGCDLGRPSTDAENALLAVGGKDRVMVPLRLNNALRVRAQPLLGR